MTVLNMYRNGIPPGAIDIMRPNKMGNPFRIGPDGTRKEVLRKHKAWLWEEIADGRVTVDELIDMDGRDLVCCCKPEACHGDEVERAIEWAVRQRNR